MHVCCGAASEPTKRCRGLQPHGGYPALGWSGIDAGNKSLLSAVPDMSWGHEVQSRNRGTGSAVRFILGESAMGVKFDPVMVLVPLKLACPLHKATAHRLELMTFEKPELI